MTLADRNPATEAPDGAMVAGRPTATPESGAAGIPENTAPSERRPGRRLWVKGQSGNPGGRPKAEAAVRDLARRLGPRAVRRLAQLMRSPNERVAVAACQALLDRGYGKPAQVVTNNGSPLVAINMSGGTALTPAEAYRALCSDPALNSGDLLPPALPAAQVDP